ncbi:MAG: bifunctional 5,10-methylenetetrahydrofolate dehydrogenase/5,10-methenyltetrahydrofolate cyclohydrolase [Deltaproteobacteria bacterium]|nr:bifunctional 5,10-methylenetetrahydrofolate dehydrogenase/5,10-methenyltetrahydrofolate cyclohydrolase [Deltaproteobacteria bacterium]
MKVIDGKAAAAALREKFKQDAAGLGARLDVVLVGDNAASTVYVRNKEKACGDVGIVSRVHRLPTATTEAAVVDLVRGLSADREVDGILVQLPLPKGISERVVIEAIAPEKDVDGLTAVNAGRLLLGAQGHVPCTPLGVMHLIETTGVAIAGKRAVVVGRSNLVGKPVAQLLQRADATVTVCHSKTIELAVEIARAEIVVAAIGRPEFVHGDWIRTGAVVIDVGINRLEDGRLVGDVAFDRAAERAGWITPVPGGVGPMTVAMLLSNTLAAARARR